MARTGLLRCLACHGTSVTEREELNPGTCLLVTTLVECEACEGEGVARCTECRDAATEINSLGEPVCPTHVEEPICAPVELSTIEAR